MDPCFSAHGSPRLAREFTLDQAFYDQLSEALGERLKACSGVPVVTGYFGNVPAHCSRKSDVDTPISARLVCRWVLLQRSCRSGRRWTASITADPRKVPTARLIPAITPEEAAELTYYGSEVITQSP